MATSTGNAAPRAGAGSPAAEGRGHFTAGTGDIAAAFARHGETGRLAALAPGDSITR